MPHRLAIMNRLMTDHVDARRALLALEQEVDRIAQFHAPDAQALADALRFFGDHMDRVHHPLEDLIYGALKRRDPALGLEIDKIAHEHEEASGLLAQLSDVTHGLLADPGISRAAFCRTARGVIAFQRHHMRREESGLFNRAGDELKTDDWQAIALTSRGLTPQGDQTAAASAPGEVFARAATVVREDVFERRTAARKKIEGLSADLRRRSGHNGR